MTIFELIATRLRDLTYTRSPWLYIIKLLLLVIGEVVRTSNLLLLLLLLLQMVLVVFGFRGHLLHVLVRRYGYVLVLDFGRLFVFLLLLLLLLQLLLQFLFLFERILFVLERVLERVGRHFRCLRVGVHHRRFHVLVRGRRGQVLVASGGRLFEFTGLLLGDRRRWQRYVLVRYLRLRQILVLRKNKNPNTYIST